jgi:phosphoserine aminotransferase
MKRVYNFAPGPAILPHTVMSEVQRGLLDHDGTGISVMEMSHRSTTFRGILEEAKRSLKTLMSIPEGYEILFLQGGASTQFAMVPLNLLIDRGRASYVNTGRWAQKAIDEAKRYGEIRIVASSEEAGFNYIPSIDEVETDIDYFHITMNNTIYGTRFTTVPDTAGVPLVSDMSSCILSEIYDMERFALVYAGAQKNIGPAGLTIVIIRGDLIGRALEMTPTMLRYETHRKADSLYNTPPCFNIYFALLVFRWIEERGGVAAIEKENKKKAALLYDYLDGSKIFRGTASKKDRSLMNVTFLLPDEQMTDRFLEKAESLGLVSLRGHRSVGGLRASLYNAMPIEGVEKLVAAMDEFEKKNA